MDYLRTTDEGPIEKVLEELEQSEEYQKFERENIDTAEMADYMRRQQKKAFWGLYNYMDYPDSQGALANRAKIARHQRGIMNEADEVETQLGIANSAGKVTHQRSLLLGIANVVDGFSKSGLVSVVT